jgi:hypothetical protein
MTEVIGTSDAKQRHCGAEFRLRNSTAELSRSMTLMSLLGFHDVFKV